MAPNDAGVPDPGQDSYAGSVEKPMRDQATRQVWEEYRDDAGWRHDPDHQLDLDAATQEARRRAEQFTAEQHDRLSHGIAMRGGPQVGGTNYLGIPHDQLHEMVNDDIEPGMVDKAGESWNKVGMGLRSIGDRLTKASAETEQGWSGNAAAGALRFNSGLASWSETTAQGALLSSNNMATQSDAAGTVKNTVPPPMKYSLWDEVTDLLSAPDPVSGANTVRAKLQQQQELHRQAADAVAAYDQTLGNSSSTMPAFETPPAFDPNFHDATRTPGGGNEPPPGRHTQVAPAAGPPPSGGAEPPSSHESPPRGGPASGSPPDPNSMADDPRVRQPGSTDTDPSWADLGSPGQGRLGDRGLGVDSPGGLGSGGSRGVGEPGFGAAPVGGWGGGPGAGGRAGVGGPGGVGGVDGRVPGPGAGALPAEQAALGRGAPGAAGGRGAAGVGAMPIGASASRRGGEDEEHERPSYLLEEHPNAVFGTDEAISPPVIE